MSVIFVLSSGNSGNLSISASSAQVDVSAYITGSGDTVRLVSDVDCYVRATNASGTAVNTDVKLIAAQPESFSLPPDTVYIVCLGSASGTLNWAVSSGG